MKSMIMLSVATLALHAHARDARPGFYESVGGRDEAQVQQPATPLGEVHWIKAADRARLKASGIEMVALMDTLESKTVGFDSEGTAYLIYDRVGERTAVRISKRAGGLEGNFIVDGWPYLISQGQVVGLDDSWLKEKISHLGDLREREHVRAIGKGAILGISTLLMGMVASWLGVPHAVPATLLGALAGGTYYGWLRRDRFKLSQLELGFAGNRFSKKLRGLDRVVSYAKTPTGDVTLELAVPGGGTRTESLRGYLARTGKGYRARDCVDYLTRVIH